MFKNEYDKATVILKSTKQTKHVDILYRYFILKFKHKNRSTDFEIILN